MQKKSFTVITIILAVITLTIIAYSQKFGSDYLRTQVKMESATIYEYELDNYLHDQEGRRFKQFQVFASTDDSGNKVYTVISIRPPAK